MKTYIVDSFTDQPFKGNPAGVCLVTEQISDETMQSIAIELRHSETAFVTETELPNTFRIRYFSPIIEIPLCGHATLAASKVLFSKPCFNAAQGIKFLTHHGLELDIGQEGDAIVMEFPVYEIESAEAPQLLLDALGVSPIVNSGYNAETQILLLEIESTRELADLTPNFQQLKASHHGIRGVLVTARAKDDFDFHSRYFWPWSGGEEDPVTGGTHTFLAKYWAGRLGKTKMRSFQSSRRTGSMDVELAKGKLFIKGQAVINFEGEFFPNGTIATPKEPESFDVGDRSFKFVRSLTNENLTQLFDLYHEEWPSSTRTLEDMVKVARGSEFLIGIVEETSNELVGFCRVLSDRGFRAWMFGMLVREDMRGIGLGGRIMDKLVDSPELAKTHSLSLTCAPDMIPFYEKWRFQLRDPQVVMGLGLRS